MKAVLKYPGAKNRLAPWICEHIPHHDVYLEPFAGSLAVLFNKERSHIETVNDLDGNIVNFFKVLRENGKLLIGDVAFSTRAQLERCKADCGDEWDEDEIYFVFEEIERYFPGRVKFEQISYCAGILTISR